MSLLPLEDLFSEIQRYAPTAPEPSMLMELRQASRLFCARTKAWREDEHFTVSAPGYEALCASPEVSILEIEAAQLDGHSLTPISVVDLDKRRRGWRTDTEPGAASFVTQRTPNSLTIYPREAGRLDAGLVLQPSRSATLVPDWLVTEYGTEIGRAAAGALLLLPRTEYHNAEIGTALQSAFGAFVARRAISMRRGQQNAPMRTTPRFF